MGIRVRDVHFSFDPARRVLSGVNAGFEEGTMTAIIGPNGSGKSTLLRLVLGVLMPQSGSIEWHGRGVHTYESKERARRMAYLPQRSLPAFAFSVREMVELGRYAHAGTDRSWSADAALDCVGLRDRAEEAYEVLSVGQQQRVSFARALAQLGCEREDAGAEGRVLLADEPISAMDPLHAVRTLEAMRTLTRRGGCVVVVLHDLSLVQRCCDRVLALGSHGQVLCEGATDAVVSPEHLRKVFGVEYRVLRDESGKALAAIPG